MRDIMSNLTGMNRTKNNVNKLKKIMVVLLCVTSIFTIIGCGNKEEVPFTEAPVVVRVAGMKGPTTMGLLHMMDKFDAEETQADETARVVENEANDSLVEYEFRMMTAADEILPLMIKKELDIALIPANVASILYQKTNGGICVIDINTLGVLYLVSGDASISFMEDLRGKTIYLTGKGTTPDYVLQYLLEANQISLDEVTLEYKSEATEVAALLKEKTDAIGLLPQPFVTVACASNDQLKVVMDLNEQWKLAQGEDGGIQVTGVTVVRKEFLEANEEAVLAFMKEHQESSAKVMEDLDKSATLCVEADILPKEQVAKAALPKCNITYVDGEDMKKALSSYLEVLYGENPEFIGGNLPLEDFYYVQ